MSREKREPDHPPELETHFILRLPEEPAKQLREVLKTGEQLKNRLTIQVENDMRSGEVRLDHWLMNAKIVDLPTLTESLKTIDNKSFYKCADICQMMVCKLEPDQSPVEEETDKRKKKDSYKVDKKFLYPHGITPPAKNVRKRRFRKTLRKKCAEAPEIEKEVKRLLRADNEAVSVTWEIVNEDEDQFQSTGQPSISAGSTKTTAKPEKKSKAARAKEKAQAAKNVPSNEVDIFGGAVSDSEEEEIVREMEVTHLSAYDSRLSDTNSMQGGRDVPARHHLPIEFASEMFAPPDEIELQASSSQTQTRTLAMFDQKSGDLSSEEEVDYSAPKDNMQEQIDQLRAELEELKQRKHRTQQEIAGMENLALKQRFQETLHTLNQDIMYKDMKYQGLLVLQNSEDI